MVVYESFHAKDQIFLEAQRDSYLKEINVLTNNKPLLKTRKLMPIRPFLSDALLKGEIRGKIGQSFLHVYSKHQINSWYKMFMLKTAKSGSVKKNGMVQYLHVFILVLYTSNHTSVNWHSDFGTKIFQLVNQAQIISHVLSKKDTVLERNGKQFKQELTCLGKSGWKNTIEIDWMNEVTGQK